MKEQIDFVYRKIFSYGIGERTATFFHGFHWSIAAAVISKGVAGFTTLMAARWLGPKEFGEANLSLAATLWIQIPIFLGVHTAIMHYVSKAPPEDKPYWISQGIKLMTGIAFLTCGAGYLFRAWWASLLGIPEKFFILALVWCFCFWSLILLKSLLNALEKFVFRSWVEILFALIFPLSFLFWAFSGFRSAAYILGLSLPYLVVGVGGLVYLRPSLKGRFIGSEQTKKLFYFGLLSTTSSLILALFESPAKLIANKVLDISEVGILSAYQSGSTQMSLFLLMAVSQVFFPIASRTPDKRVLFKKLNYVLWRLFPFLAVLFAAGLFLYFFVLGRNYSIHPSLCVLFSVAAALGFVYGMLQWFILSYGWRGICLNALTGVAAGCVNVLGCLWAIPRFHILGAGGAYLTATAVWIGLLYLPPVQRWLNAAEEAHE